MFTVLHCSTSNAGVLHPELNIESVDNSSTDYYFSSWLNRFSIIEPILEPKSSKINHYLLIHLYEQEILKNVNNKIPTLTYPINSVEENYKKKYFDLLAKLSSHKSEEIIPKPIYKVPTDYNLIIIVYDIVPAKLNYNSFCKVFVNKQNVGLTNQALLSQKKILKLKVIPNVQHMLQVEKHFLNEKQNKWERMRNLLQPKTKFFKIPKDRIRVIEIIYDSSFETPDKAHLKYKFKTHFMAKDEEI
ncbi:MAG: hypothetical protein OEV44_03290 [Spirochaetota bacterium]|nr:hypothetical protein [Spirochaetota bacterium]